MGGVTDAVGGQLKNFRQNPARFEPPSSVVSSDAPVRADRPASGYPERGAVPNRPPCVLRICDYAALLGQYKKRTGAIARRVSISRRECIRSGAWRVDLFQGEQGFEGRSKSLIIVEY
jgi:hypothetical protein